LTYGLALVFSLEPQRTQFDLHFRVFGIPTRIHPGFWLAAFILGFGVTDQGRDPVPLLLFMLVEFVSILVHELGHALLMRRYGYAPRIVLYHLGGLAIRDQGYSFGLTKPSRHDVNQSILISLAGPGAGFLLAALTVLLIYAGGGSVSFGFMSWGGLPWQVRTPESWSRAFELLAHFSLVINIFWGLINLVPVLPLDGGQVARELLMHRDPYRGLAKTLQLSIVVGLIAAVFLWIGMREQFAGIMFALLALSNYLALQQLGRSW
jgi:Zn-dependent protease